MTYCFIELPRSANAVDCSGMDLEPLDESLSQQNLCNTSRIVSEIRINPFDQKALTSTASAQRTQSALLKSTSKTGSEADNMRKIIIKKLKLLYLKTH